MCEHGHPLLCTSAALCTHTQIYIFAFFVLLGSFGKRYKHFPTYAHTNTHRRRGERSAPASAHASVYCGERAQESETASSSSSSLAAVQASRECTFKISKPKQLPLLSLLLAHIQMEKRATAKSTFAHCFANMFSFAACTIPPFRDECVADARRNVRRSCVIAGPVTVYLT